MTTDDRTLEPLTADEGHPRLRVGGFEPLTTIQWESRLSAVVSLQGCPWRCRYCHNAELTPLTTAGMTSWASTLKKIEARRGFIDAVIFSGGEPTFQSGLSGAIREVKQMGFEVALESNGYEPEALEAVLAPGDLDFVAMDIKAPFEEYELITQVPSSGDGPRNCVPIVLASGIEYEFRTTCHPALLTPHHLRVIAGTLAQMGAERWVVQLFRPEGCPVKWLRESIALPAEVPDALRGELSDLIDDFDVRGAD